MRTRLSTAPRRAVTLRDVAQAIGMSDFTVSSALNGKSGVAEATRQIVLEAARELGYTPNPHAQRLANGLSNNHVDIVSLQLDWGMGARKARWIQNLLLERGFTAPIHAYEVQPHKPQAGRDFIAALCRQRPRAIVLDSSATQQAEFEELQRYRDEGGIVICYGYHMHHVGEFDWVLFDGGHSIRSDPHATRIIAPGARHEIVRYQVATRNRGGIGAFVIEVSNHDARGGDVKTKTDA